MIRNRHAWLLAATALWTACGGGTDVPPGFQGIVEYETRVVAFEESGKVTKVSVQRGDVVKDGDELARVDDTLARLNRDARAADVDAALADVALVKAGARREDVAATEAELRAAVVSEQHLQTVARRAHSLLDQNAIAKAEVDQADTELSRATSQRQAIEQRLAALRRGARPQEIARVEAQSVRPGVAVSLEDARLARFTVRAYGAGEVLDVHVKPGELAAVGTPVATLADTSHPYADVFVPQAQLGGVTLGARAAVRVDSVAAPLPAVVEYIARQTEFTPRFLFSERERSALVVRVRVRIDDPKRLLHAGLPAFAQVDPLRPAAP
ncbi:MAG: secretion protein HlyD family protein [Deltaproteobacteria bacterium]|nr:secretion protein HlyD family protein [Deltaproteobacteria bacterium]